jgi:hypothetical protein
MQPEDQWVRVLFGVLVGNEQAILKARALFVDVNAFAEFDIVFRDLDGNGVGRGA